MSIVEITEQVTEAQPELTPEQILEQAAAPEVEAAPAPEEKPEPKDDRFASKFAALTRQEKQIKQLQKQIAEREKALAEREKALLAPREEPKKPEEPLELRLKRDTFGTLKELGLTPETLVQMMLNDGKPTQELQMQLLKDEVSRSSKSEFEQLKAELQELKKAREEEQQAKQEQELNGRITGFKSQIGDFVAKDTDTYDLIASEGEQGIDLIYDLIAQDAQEKAEKAKEDGLEFTGEEIMSIEEAAQKVEAQLLEEAKKRIERSKKVKSLLGPKDSPATPPNVPGKKATATLSNSAAQVQSGPKVYTSDAERMAAAAAMLKKLAD